MLLLLLMSKNRLRAHKIRLANFACPVATHKPLATAQFGRSIPPNALPREGGLRSTAFARIRPVGPSASRPPPLASSLPRRFAHFDGWRSLRLATPLQRRSQPVLLQKCTGEWTDDFCCVPSQLRAPRRDPSVVFSPMALVHPILCPPGCCSASSAKIDSSPRPNGSDRPAEGWTRRVF